MEFPSNPLEILAVLHMIFAKIDEGLEFFNVLFCGTSGRLRRHIGLDKEANLKNILCRNLPRINQAPKRLTHGFVETVVCEDAPLGPPFYLDEASPFQQAQGLSNDGPADTKFLCQVNL